MKTRINTLLIIIVVVFHSAAFIYQIYNRNIYLSDSLEYLQQAGNIKNYGIAYSGDIEKPHNLDLFTKRPPLYSVFINVARIFHSDDLVVLFFQNILSLLNIFLVARLAARLFPGSINILLVFFILSPVQFIYANLMMSEILFQTFLILILLVFIKFLKTSRPVLFLLISILLILSMLTKPVMYPFSIIVLLAGVFYAFKRKSPKTALYASLPLIFVFAYSYWNLERTGYYHFSSIQNINLVNYNAYFFLSNIEGKAKADEVIGQIHKKANKIDDYAEKQKFLRSEATSIILQNKTKYFRFHTMGVVRFFLDPGRFDFFNFLGIEEQGEGGFLYILNQQGFKSALKYMFNQNPLMILVLFITMLMNLIKTVGFVFFIFIANIRMEIRVAAVILVLYLAAATGPLGASRFVLPVLPFIILAAAVSYSWFFQNKGKFLNWK